LRQAKLQFNRLQAAYDAGDRAALADVMTPEMMTEIGRDLEARDVHHPTEVVTLDAEVLEVATEAGRHWASVRFTGLVREDGAPHPRPLDEIWNLTKPTDGSSGWLLAGIQQAN
jgi:predicted lipid-binding transport protein (Tim44 family)